MSFTYAEAESLLAKLYQADESAQRGAFRGRLKHLHRLGIPMGRRPGRGKKVSYDREQIYQWAFCLDRPARSPSVLLIAGVVLLVIELLARPRRSPQPTYLTADLHQQLQARA